MDENRLYVMNLPFAATEDSVRRLFERFGELEEVLVPLRFSGESKGIAFVRFADTECAVAAFAALHRTIYQGRILHILPAKRKPVTAEAHALREREVQETAVTGPD